MFPPLMSPHRRDYGIWSLEKIFHRYGFTDIAGADEAGRGCCAGPLVAAAVVLPGGKSSVIKNLQGITDSKLLTAARRDYFYDAVVAEAVSYSVVGVSAFHIDQVGVHQANIAALAAAINHLRRSIDYAIIDGFSVPSATVPQLAVRKGDQVAACISAASIMAKVTRDRMMIELDRQWPGYGFAQHKGYGTAGHMQAVSSYGPCPEHRFSYANISPFGQRQLTVEKTIEVIHYE